MTRPIIMPVPTGTVIELENIAQYFSNHLESIADAKAHTLDKIAFYLAGGWESVSDVSYQSHDDDTILSKDATKITKSIKQRDTIYELGPGDYKKTEKLLDTICDHKLGYTAVDCSIQSLRTNIPKLAEKYPNICCVGICATFDRWLKFICTYCADETKASMHIWSFGSSLSNAPRAEVIRRIQQCATAAESIWIGQDGTCDEAKIKKHYQSKQFQEFLQRGKEFVDGVFGYKLFTANQWHASQTISMSTMEPCYKEILRAKEDMTGTSIQKDAELALFFSYKYTEEQMRSMAEQADATVGFVCSHLDAGIYHIQPRAVKLKDAALGSNDY